MAGLAGHVADGAPGDLDPTFGDAGRLVIEDSGPVWSLELEDAGDGFLAGGNYGCYYSDCYANGFTYPFSSVGELDLGFTHPVLAETQILDTARQLDGKLVGTGITRARPNSTLTVFRLGADGTLDATFGEDGLVQLEPQATASQQGTSMVLEPDGRIVVAGSRGNRLLMVRLLADGTLDQQFGNAGVVVGPEGAGDVRLVRASDGRYRVSITDAADWPDSTCRIVAFAADGTLDQSFGTAGIVDAAPDLTDVTRCQALAIQPDDRLLVAGGVGHGGDASGLLVRLLRDGSADDTFSAPAVVAQMSQATALTFDPGGKLLVAGQGPSDVAGALVARLAADGVLDTTFGNAGTTWIDLPAFQPQVARVNDLAAGTDGSLTLAGSYGYSAPFAARLSGDGSADAAGVVSMTHPVIATIDGEAQAVVTVRRAGGKAGAVSVAWRTEPVDDPSPASPGIDYGEVTGQLTWDDGDMTDREIAIPVIPDMSAGTESIPEGYESFWLKIDSPEGGAGLGGQATLVQIAADGAPAGQFNISTGQWRLVEGETIELWANRDYYSTGAVSVTVEVSGNPTADVDYELGPTVLTWADGEAGSKLIRITARDDDVDEKPAEELILKLTGPQGGAIIGRQARTSVLIVDGAPEGGGGGGSFGWASLLAICSALLKRRHVGHRRQVLRQAALAQRLHYA